MIVGVTGATGFIGNEIVKYLIKKKYVVISFLRNSKKAFKHKNNYVVNISNISDFKDWKLHFNKIDVLIHTAAKKNNLNEDNIKNSVTQFTDINKISTLKIANQAIKSGVKKFIFLSTVKVNGENTKNGDLFSTNSKFNPIDIYGKSKLEAEKGLNKLSKNNNNMDIIVLRLPIVYGPNVSENFLSLINLINMQLPLPFGNLNHNRRSFLSTYNLCDFINCIIKNKEFLNTTFYVTDDDDLSTKKLILTIGKITKKRVLLIPIPEYIIRFVLRLINRKNYAKKLLGNLEVDISYTKTRLKWKPPLNFEKSLEKSLIEEYKN